MPAAASSQGLFSGDARLPGILGRRRPRLEHHHSRAPPLRALCTRHGEGGGAARHDDGSKTQQAVWAPAPACTPPPVHCCDHHPPESTSSTARSLPPSLLMAVPAAATSASGLAPLAATQCPPAAGRCSMYIHEAGRGVRVAILQTSCSILAGSHSRQGRVQRAHLGARAAGTARPALAARPRRGQWPRRGAAAARAPGLQNGGSQVTAISRQYSIHSGQV